MTICIHRDEISMTVSSELQASRAAIGPIDVQGDLIKTIEAMNARLVNGECMSPQRINSVSCFFVPVEKLSTGLSLEGKVTSASSI